MEDDDLRDRAAARGGARRGAEEVVLGIGGSATNDGGLGAAAALGVAVLRADGSRIARPTAEDLPVVRGIGLADRHPRLAEVRLRVACDVDNPMTGPARGGVRLRPAEGGYGGGLGRARRGPAEPGAGVPRLAARERERPAGAGAAGGFGGGAVAMLGAELVPGAELLLDAIGFDGLLAGVDLVVTGEGKLDAQTGSGKAVAAVARRAAAAGVPVVALAGRVEVDDPTTIGLRGRRDRGGAARGGLDPAGAGAAQRSSVPARMSMRSPGRAAGSESVDRGSAGPFPLEKSSRHTPCAVAAELTVSRPQDAGSRRRDSGRHTACACYSGASSASRNSMASSSLLRFRSAMRRMPARSTR